MTKGLSKRTTDGAAQPSSGSATAPRLAPEIEGGVDSVRVLSSEGGAVLCIVQSGRIRMMRLKKEQVCTIVETGAIALRDAIS